MNRVWEHSRELEYQELEHRKISPAAQHEELMLEKICSKSTLKTPKRLKQ